MNEEKAQILKKLFLYPIMLIITLMPLTISWILNYTIEHTVYNYFSVVATSIYGLHGFCSAIIYGFTIGIKKTIKDYFNYSSISLEPKNVNSFISKRSESSDSPNLLFDSYSEVS